MDSLNDAWVTLPSGKRVLAVTDLTASEGQTLSEVINKWGSSPDIDVADAAAGQVIWPVKSTVQQYIFLDSAIPLFVKSSSSNDAIAGTGAQKVLLTNWHGSDGNAADAVELDMDGVNNVALPEDSFGVFSFEVSQSGTGNKNAGNIDIVDGSGDIYARISTGEGRTQIACQRIPNDKNGLCLEHRATISALVGFFASAEDATLRLRKRKVDGTIITVWDPIITTDNPQDVKEYSVGGITLSPGEWLFWECIAVSAADTPIKASFDIELFESE